MDSEPTYGGNMQVGDLVRNRDPHEQGIFGIVIRMEGNCVLVLHKM